MTLSFPIDVRPIAHRGHGLRAVVGLVLAVVAGTSTAGCRSEVTAAPPPTSVDRLTEEIRRIVPVSERQRRLLAIVDEVEVLQQQYELEAAAIRRRWRGSNSDYDATAADLAEVLADSQDERRAYLSAVTALRVEAASLLTVEEWRKLASRRHAARDTVLGL